MEMRREERVKPFVSLLGIHGTTRREEKELRLQESTRIHPPKCLPFTSSMLTAAIIISVPAVVMRRMSPGTHTFFLVLALFSGTGLDMGLSRATFLRHPFFLGK